MKTKKMAAVKEKTRGNAPKVEADDPRVSPKIKKLGNLRRIGVFSASLA
ncbi:MAG TPA: hypothetical protein VL404_07065 [Candidatus Eisenbacteria bacterium]|nr:hypothetical protein [Candidatus Eisenbacteria bacterium]